ncbi:MAG: TetR/AcrR family transcriptional regulator [Bauldia sp.]|nr:TetR/AcrR family transcriptional regulator [Bauldia sp.]
MRDGAAPGRRESILTAALGLFLERGYAATSIADVRAASGASTGSIYHFFTGKGGIAHALLTEAVAGWSAVGNAPPDASAEVAIKASVTGLVRWAAANPGQFRLMDELRSLALHDPDLAEVGTALAAGQGAAGAAYRRYVAAGHVKPLAWPVAHAVMLGPAYAWLRLPAESRKPGARHAAELLADAAWAAVRMPGRRSAR